MAWTDISGDVDTDRERVRDLVGDHKDTDHLIDDEHIDRALVDEANIYGAAAAVCVKIAAIMARESDVTHEGYSKRLSSRFDQFMKLGEFYRTKSRDYELPYAGGISEDEWQDWQQDTDLIQPTFIRGQFDNRDGVDMVGADE